MLWYSAAVMLILTVYAWRTARQMNADRDSSGLRTAYLTATVCGLIGTLCFVFAALI